MCGVETKPPRYTFCGDECVEEWKVKNSSGFARRAVRKRDKGVCALCGLDCTALRRRLLKRRHDHGLEFVRVVLRVLGLPRRHSVYQTLWNADHTLPRAEGGGMCGLENLRTLCVWCHRGETRKLHQRLKERRIDAAFSSAIIRAHRRKLRRLCS